MTLEELIEGSGLDASWEIGEGGNASIVTVALNDGRTQRVSVRQARAEGGRWVRLASVIGPAESMTQERLRRALTLNFELLSGCLALASDEIVLTQTYLLETLTPSILATGVESLARLADRYEHALFGVDQS